jgi:hypothetical protein
MTDSGPNRLETYTAKIAGDRTGLRGSVFLHVDHDGRGFVHGVRFSEHAKDGSTLDRLLHALGDEATEAMRVIARPRGPHHYPERAA